MPVLRSFLRTSTNPEVMKYIEAPGAPSRTMICCGGKSRVFMRATICWHSSEERVLKSLMFWRECSPGLGAGADVAMYASNERLEPIEPDVAVLLGRPETSAEKAGDDGEPVG